MGDVVNVRRMTPRKCLPGHGTPAVQMGVTGRQLVQLRVAQSDACQLRVQGLPVFLQTTRIGIAVRKGDPLDREASERGHCQGKSSIDGTMPKSMRTYFPLHIYLT